MAITPNGRPADASPLGKGPRRLSDYEREIAHALMRKGIPKERAIPMARGLLKKAAASGRWGDKGKAGAKTRAGAAASIAQRKDFSNVDLAFNPAELRDADGKWTKGETRSWLAAHPVDHRNIVAMYDKATPGEKAAGESWYPNAHKIAVAMAKKHGVTTRQAAGVIAAYSPQTPWGKNLMEANEVLRNHKALGGPGAHLDIVRTPNDTNESRYGVMASGTNAGRAKALLGGADFENVFGGKRNKNGSLPPHALKIRSFAELIAAGGQTDPRRTKVVIDRHAASVARGVRLTEDDYAVDGPSSSKVKYKAYADAYRQAAEVISKREGRTITPEALQATTWLTRQRLNNVEAPNGRKALGNRDASESLNYFASYEPNIADIVGKGMTGYAELSKVHLKDTDLAFNPAEKRDEHGRWTNAFKVVAKRLNMEAHSDGGPTRDKMPQLSGVPLPGSKADKMFPGRAPGSEVDLADQFEPWLNKHGVKVVDTEVPSSVLKPTQDELNEAKVIGIAKFMQKAPKDSPVFNPIYVSGDNHVIDGHHRWAGNEVRNEVEGVPRWMKIRQVQADKETSLRLATQFMDEYGLPRVGVDQGTAVVSTFARKAAASLSNVYTLKETDLSVRHVRTPAGSEKYGEPIGAVITKDPLHAAMEKARAELKANPPASHGVKPTSKWPANAKKVKLNGRNYSLDSAVELVGEAYSWPDMDKEGGGDPASIEQQHKAQVLGKVWYESTGGDKPADEQYAASLWEQYQSPSLYGKINDVLRTGHVEPGDPSQADIQKYANLMFEKGGFTTEKPMTVFRALKSNQNAPTGKDGKPLPGYHDWSKELTPGTVFTDKGLVSTTANETFSQGWLMGDAQGADVKRQNPNDVVLELRLPTGQRIVGGDPQFIETMLPPGTTFKVVSQETRKAKAVNPLDHKKARFEYTHVVAEVTP